VIAVRHGVELACGQLIDGAEKPIVAGIRSKAADIVLDDARIVRKRLSKRYLSRARQMQCLNAAAYPSPAQVGYIRLGPLIRAELGQARVRVGRVAAERSEAVGWGGRRKPAR
jgi:hypothetical protein